MNITQEKINNLNSVLKVKIQPDDYRERVEKAIKSQAKKAKLPGFRPGMVPSSHIKRMYGKSILVEEINTLLSDSLTNYISENKIEILGQPLPKVEDVRDFNWDYNDEFEFDYELGLAPEFDLEVSSNDSLVYYQIKVDPATLESRSKNLRKSYGKMTNPEISSDEDVLYGELLQLSPDGSVFEDGISNTASLRLDLVTNEEIKKSLLGLKVNDIVEVDLNQAFDGNEAVISKLLNIPEDDAKELKSKFRITVKNINRLEEADLNQEFFDKIFPEGDVTTEEEFKGKITEELEGMMAQNADQKLQADLVAWGLEKVNLELPDEFLKRWLKETNKNISAEELESGYADFAKNLKWTLIENKIVKENNIQIGYEDVLASAKSKLDAQFRMYSPQAIPDEQLTQYTVQFLQNKENANRTFEEVKGQKVFEYLKSVITLDKREIEYNTFIELK